MSSTNPLIKKIIRKSILGASAGIFLISPKWIPHENIVLIDVPFVIQAPHANWDQPYQDACEEATIVMAHAWAQNDNRSKIPAHEADQRLLEIVVLEDKTIGYNRDTNLQIMADLINNFLPFEATVVQNPSLDLLLTEIDAGRPIIAPVWGRYLINQYFTPPGPTYHTIVLVGYDPKTKEFITHEPGTKRGKHFRYSFNNVMEGLQDFVPGPDNRPIWSDGANRIMILQKEIEKSAHTDADKDGLSKIEEIKHNTSLMYADTDNDGYLDGAEVRDGLNPTFNEFNIKNGALIKTKDSPKVYAVQHNKAVHIKSEEEFINAGFKWSDIITITKSFLERL